MKHYTDTVSYKNVHENQHCQCRCLARSQITVIKDFRNICSTFAKIDLKVFSEMERAVSVLNNNQSNLTNSNIVDASDADFFAMDIFDMQCWEYFDEINTDPTGHIPTPTVFALL